jgi:hypothetical protein
MIFGEFSLSIPCILQTLTAILHSMARFRMFFADIHHYIGCSDSLGIIPCRRKKIGLEFHSALQGKRCHVPTRPEGLQQHGKPSLSFARSCRLRLTGAALQANCGKSMPGGRVPHCASTSMSLWGSNT